MIRHNFFENNFCGSLKFVLSEVRIFDQIGFGRQKTAAEVVLKMTFFTFFPGEARFVKFLACRCGAFWVRVGLVAKNGLAAAVRRVFAIFSGLFFQRRFREFEDDLLKLPSSSFRVLLFFAFSSCVWGQRNPACVFWGS